jgi:iron complex outermembrane recepter protein
MRRIILFILVMVIACQASSQVKKKAGVKRKYLKTEQVNENMPQVIVHGRVLNSNREKLAGATVIVRGTRIGVNTNEDGEYYLTGLPAGKISIRVSLVGYKTKITDYFVQEGNNDVYFTLDRDDIALEPITVTSQLRDQQLMDIPAAISVLTGKMLESNNIREMSRLSEFVPGMVIREQTPHRPNYIIRGLTGDEVSLSAQPRVSVYFNNIPTSRSSLATAELYDMERVEVLKGPQETLFGRGAQTGVVRFITRTPGSETGGNLTAGYGEYGMKEFEGAVNVSVLKDKLFTRLAGIYTYRDGYVTNTFGGKLNGKNTLGCRFSLRYLPFWNTKIDVVVNYQKDDLPGTAFMSKQFPNANGITDIFQYQASLEQGKNLKNYRDVLSTSFEIRHFRNENNFFSSNTSYITNTADSRWDGDGTAAPAIDMAENIHVSQFNQELRYNFSRKSRTNGSLGVSYWREKADQTYWFNPNEQYMAYLVLQMPQYLIDSDGKANPMITLPDNPSLGSLAGMALPEKHEEENLSSATNQALDAFTDFTWSVNRQLSFTGGIRATRESFHVTNESVMKSGSPSVLGRLTGMYPNLFFKPVEKSGIKKSWLAFTYRANLKYDYNENVSFFAGYAKGRRPHVIQFNSSGESEIMNQEVLHSFDAGIKTVARRFWTDISGFYQLFRNFQTNAWVENNYFVKDAGKATSYGAEASVRIALLKNLDLFGNYAYIHARFDSIDSEGRPQEYSGNELRLTPRHSFTAGINGSLRLNSNLRFFIVPSYSWKSHIWFEDADTPGLEQDAFGTLNVSTGFSFDKPGLTFAFSGTNLLGEQYLISAGNTGTMFGVPTFVPGPPEMLSGRVTWKF